MLCFSSNLFNKVVPFTFHKMWLQHADLQRVVKAHWDTSVVGCLMFIMSKKLKMLKGVLRVWNKEVFGNIHLRVNSALDNVDYIQQCLNDLGSDQDLIEEEHQSQKELLLALNLEDELWREKSRIKWHTKGDRNTIFFHKIAKIRYATKSVTMLRDGEDILTDQSAIANLALDITLIFMPLRVKLNLTISYSSSKTPTHVLYADDIIIFCKGIKREILSLKDLFGRYSQASGKMLSLSKCKFYTHNASTRKITNISNWLGFSNAKSFLTWRLMLNKLPFDENLKKRCFSIVSICNLCLDSEETSKHLFLHCKFVNSIWRWLGSLIGFQIYTSSICSLLHSATAPWSPQLKEIRFDELTLSLNQAISRIKVDTALCGKFSRLKAKTSLLEFSILRALNVLVKYSNAPSIIEVVWFPPTLGRIKVNTDGAAHGYPSHADGGEIFRDNAGGVLGCFGNYLGIQHSLYAELFVAFFAIKVAYANG
ncbi:hypothetical protein Lal_00010994 [Lupinus albus]|nr:hypothetical protein Lal_00010994 [Lupinus albus]